MEAEITSIESRFDRAAEADGGPYRPALAYGSLS